MGVLLIVRESDDAIIHAIANTDSTALVKWCKHLGLDSNLHYAKDIEEHYTTKQARANLYIDGVGDVQLLQHMVLTIPSDSFIAGTESLTISDIPVTTEVFLNGVSVGVVTDGEVVLTSAGVATLSLEFRCFGYKTRKEIIYAT